MIFFRNLENPFLDRPLCVGVVAIFVCSNSDAELSHKNVVPFNVMFHFFPFGAFLGGICFWFAWVARGGFFFRVFGIELTIQMGLEMAFTLRERFVCSTVAAATAAVPSSIVSILRDAFFSAWKSTATKFDASVSRSRAFTSDTPPFFQKCLPWF